MVPNWFTSSKVIVKDSNKQIIITFVLSTIWMNKNAFKFDTDTDN